MNWLRRRIALWRMHRKINAAIDAYPSVDDLLATEAQHALTAMVEANRNSPAIVQYRRKREAAIKNRPLKLRRNQCV